MAGANIYDTMISQLNLKICMYKNDWKLTGNFV